SSRSLFHSRKKPAMEYNGQSETAPIRSILLKHPRDAFLSHPDIARQWRDLNYTAPPDYDLALIEYERFVALLGETVGELHFLPADKATGLDSLYVHDPVIITSRGAILCGMGKSQRQGEPEACGRFLESLGVEVLGVIEGEGKLEGGDVVWFEGGALAVGEGYRTNAEGIRQLRELTAGLVDEFVVVPLPHWQGPSDVLHLMSFISPIDSDLALVFSPLMPVFFRQWLLDRGMRLIEVPEAEFPNMACNVLTVAPRQCIMLSGNTLTKQLLEKEAVEVREYAGQEISQKGAGGPTCLTRPILRGR
ncbi:MAG: arginine deiminase family protein, partial [candidate division Zixibacteria bacterium]